ncbi:MAG: DUF1850 domain-containing protein [Ectothiorhodospiraceae bacterium]|nr:DUF1850 domain-containing protein [Ectothiorhodospiraceae bacterium]
MPAALLLAAPVGLAASGALLEVTRCDDGAVLFSRAVSGGDRWCMAWNHSVAGFTVRDCYAYLDARMVLEYSVQPDFAAGLGHAPGRGRLTGDVAGGYRIEGIDEPVPGNGYLLRPGGATVAHRLELGGEVADLSAPAAGWRVSVHVRDTGEDHRGACP